MKAVRESFKSPSRHNIAGVLKVALLALIVFGSAAESYAFEAKPTKKIQTARVNGCVPATIATSLHCDNDTGNDRTAEEVDSMIPAHCRNGDGTVKTECIESILETVSGKPVEEERLTPEKIKELTDAGVPSIVIMNPPKGGTVSHAVLVVDVEYNEKTGKWTIIYINPNNPFTDRRMYVDPAVPIRTIHIEVGGAAAVDAVIGMPSYSEDGMRGR